MLCATSLGGQKTKVKMEGEGGGSPRAEQKEVGPPHKGRSLVPKQKELEVEYLK